LFSQGSHVPQANFHPQYQNKTKNPIPPVNAQPRRAYRPSKALQNKALQKQLSSMSESYSELPRLLPQRQRTALGLFGNLYNRRLCTRVRLELLDVVF
jgi:hypothetical protein